jgi:hypothetical protein
MRIVAAALLVALLCVSGWALAAYGDDEPAAPSTGQPQNPTGGFDFGGSPLPLPPNARGTRRCALPTPKQPTEEFAALCRDARAGGVAPDRRQPKMPELP